VESLYAHASDRANWQAAVAKRGVVADTEIQMRRPSGEMVWISANLRRIHVDGAADYYEGAIQDITARKLAEVALEENRATTERILDATPDAFIATDEESRITRWNEAATTTFGWTAEEAIGKNLAETVIPPNQRAAHVEGVRRFLVRGSEAVLNRRFELTALHKTGKEFPVELSLTAIRGDSLTFTAFLRDITERLKLAEHLRQSQKMEAIGGLAAGIAHDFNNLLTVIRMNAEWVADGVPDDTKPELQEVLKATDRAAELTRHLLAYSSKQFLAPRPTDLNAVIGSLETMLRRLIPANVEIATDLDPSLCTVNVDRGQIDQVITNLVINARDAVGSSGRISVETRNLRVPAVGSPDLPLAAGEYVVVVVSDNGEGMNEEVRGRAFDPFFTTKPQGQGTGLGLSMVYGIVKQSGGDILIDSEPGLGTSVRIFLPAMSESAHGHDDRPEATIRGGTESILIVEDQESVRSAAAKFLRTLGYVVDEAGDGEMALQMLEAAGGKADLVMTDIIMPNMGGRELATRLAERYPLMKVLFMSGNSSDTVSGEPVRGAPDEYLLQKPFSLASLALAVRECLDSVPRLHA
nr:PAS domain S-box protein [Gemmatimonadaceae bacterium]